MGSKKGHHPIMPHELKHYEDGARRRLLDGDVAEAVAKLKRDDGGKPRYFMDCVRQR